ncbi:MAG TPA: hypothetical protein VGI14_20545 [Casimicrobiaceae bacterium]
MRFPRFAFSRAWLVLLAAWAILIVTPDLYRVFASLGSFGLVADNDGLIVDVVGPFATAADSPAVAAGIAPGDRIDLQAMRCIPLDSPRCRSLLSVLGGLGGKQVVLPGREMELVIRGAGDGAPRLVRMQAARPPHRFVDSLVLLLDTVVGIAVILAAFRLVWIHPGRETWGFFLYLMWFNPGQTYAYYALLQPWPLAIFLQEIAEALAHGAGFAGLLVFALRFPTDEPRPPWDRLEWTVLVLGAVIALLWLGSFANAFGFHTETLATCAFLVGYAVDATVLFILLRRRLALPVQDGQRMLWVIWGCAIGLSSFIFAEIAQSTSLLQHALGWSPPIAVVGLLYLLNGVLAYFVSVAILHRRVISVAVPLRHATILTVLALALGIPIVNLHELLSHYQESFRIPEWVWLFVIAPIALVLLQRLHEIGVHVADRLLNRRFHAARRQLQDAGSAMSTAQGFGDIDALLVNAPVHALDLASGAVFRNQDGTFRRTRSVGWDDSPVRELQRGKDDAVLRSVETCAPVRLPRDAWDRHGLEPEVQAPCLAVPVCSDALGPIAVAAFGPHKNGNDIDDDEREMLRELATRAARGYERTAFNLLNKEVTDLRAKLAASQAAAPSPAAPRQQPATS